MLVIQTGKASGHGFLSAKSMNHPHPVQALLEEDIQSAHLLPDQAVRPPCLLLKEEDRGDQQRQDGKGDEREFQIEVKHGRHDRARGEEVADGADQPAGKEVLQVLHVRGHPGKDAAGGVAVEVAEG
jgi:hypothetical protein